MPAAAAILSIMTLVAACNSDWEPVDPLPLCDAEPDLVPVDELGHEPWASCDMEGLLLQFPDGTEIEVPESNRTRLSSDPGIPARWTVHNWDSYATIASYRTEGSLQYWGTLEGIERVRLGGQEIEDF